MVPLSKSNWVLPNLVEIPPVSSFGFEKRVLILDFKGVLAQTRISGRCEGFVLRRILCGFFRLRRYFLSSVARVQMSEFDAT